MEDTIRGLWKWDIDEPAQKLRPFAQWAQACLNAIRDFFRNMSDLEIVILILLINLTIVLVYLIIHLSKKRWKKGLLLSAFMLSMPIVAPMYLLSAEILQAIQKLFGDRDVSMEELSFDQTRVRQILDPDAEKERNVVPLEEALIISDRNNKREAFLEIIKENEVDSLGAIRDAVRDEDPEIAHYAASYVTDMVTRIKQQEASLRKAFEEESTPQKCDAYARHLRNALGTGVFEGMEQRKYLECLEKAYLWQLEHSPQDCSIENMTALTRQWLDINEAEKAEQWFERIHPRCYEDLEAFKACAIYYYRCHDRAGLKKLFEEVHSCALELDSEALEWIRFFQ